MKQVWLVTEKQEADRIIHAVFASVKAAEKWIREHDAVANEQHQPTIAHQVDIHAMSVWD